MKYEAMVHEFYRESFGKEPPANIKAAEREILPKLEAKAKMLLQHWLPTDEVGKSLRFISVVLVDPCLSGRVGALCKVIELLELGQEEWLKEQVAKP